MPEISRFFGIVIKMFFDDHNPPHFHAEYGGDLALIDIRTLAVFSGRLPPRVTGLVIEWATLHHQELLADWDRARAGGAAEDRALGVRTANQWVETVAGEPRLSPKTLREEMRRSKSREETSREPLAG